MGWFGNKNKTEKAATVNNQFEYGDKKYNVLRGCIIPLSDGSVTLTAADICIHAEAQKYLVENKCRCIEEAID